MEELLKETEAATETPPAQLNGYTKQLTVTFSAADYSIKPACFMCRIAYPLGYATEAMGVIEQSLNPSELNNTGSRGLCAEAQILVQHLEALEMGIR